MEIPILPTSIIIFIGVFLVVAVAVRGHEQDACKARGGVQFNGACVDPKVFK